MSFKGKALGTIKQKGKKKLLLDFFFFVMCLLTFYVWNDYLQMFFSLKSNNNSTIHKEAEVQYDKNNLTKDK